MTLKWHIFLQFSKSKFTATTSITSLHSSISNLTQLYSSQLQLNVLMVAKQQLPMHLCLFLNGMFSYLSHFDWLRKGASASYLYTCETESCELQNTSPRFSNQLKHKEKDLSKKLHRQLF